MNKFGPSLFFSLSLHLLLLWVLLLALYKTPGSITPPLVVELAEIEPAPVPRSPLPPDSEKPESAAASGPSRSLPGRRYADVPGVSGMRESQAPAAPSRPESTPLPLSATAEADPAKVKRLTPLAAPLPPAVEGSGTHGKTGAVSGGGAGAPSSGISRGTASAKTGTGGAIEAAGKRYVNEQFAYIMEIINGRLVYPQRARRAGWEGKVGVSFVITETGQVAEIRVVESSGHELLDENVIAAIRAAAPFPRPPVRAELRMPIQYRLNR